MQRPSPLLLQTMVLLALMAAGSAADRAAVAETTAPAAAAAPGVTSAGASVVALAPLTTVIRSQAAGGWTGGPCAVEADVVVPAGAPADLGVGAWFADRHGRWFQRLLPGRLKPGRHHLRIEAGPQDPLHPEGHEAAWSAAAAATVAQAGLLWWSARGVPPITVARLKIVPLAPPSPVTVLQRLTDLTLPSMRPVTGQRWELHVRPVPYPANPFDTAEFRLDLTVTAPDGTVSRIAGFHDQPMVHVDRGDREVVTPSGPARFAARFRPRQPGVHTMQLTATWPGRTVTTRLPDLVADGRPWDGYARVDKTDQRFFARDGAFLWPIGMNLRSVNDKRGEERLSTKLTPDRGLFSYDAYLRRLSAAGGDIIEVWMASWNLALEWRADWPGYYGQGRYSEENAWRLDRLLDRCEELGVLVNLTLINHGQLSPKADREWPGNPYNIAQGGRLKDAAQWFDDPWALAGQERVRRYTVARYADSPAILGWKLSSEINLTAAKGELSVRWHERSAAWFANNDPYGHPVTSHWSGTYRTPDRAICALPGLTYLCIDAYLGRGKNDKEVPVLAQLLAESTDDPAVAGPGAGLSAFAKPLLVTEYGGGWNGAPAPQITAEQASAGWAGLVTGHAGAPMIWWYEWVDQQERYGSYTALRAFTIGEDLRGDNARGTAMDGLGPQGPELWIRAWSRPGRILGYILDLTWAAGGLVDREVAGASVRIGSQIAAGRLRVGWWACEAPGGELSSSIIEHQGGELVAPIPPLRRHLAFKLERLTPAPPAVPEPVSPR